MYFAGTDIIVKMYNSPYPIPSITSSFIFPNTRLRVAIEQGNLMYPSFDGRTSMSPVGFCSDPAAKSQELCEEQGKTWTVYASLGNTTDYAKIQLNATHLKTALDNMLDYYEVHAINNDDFMALLKWTNDIKDKADKQLAFTGPGIEKTARLIDAVGIQINNQQPVSPLYSPGSPLMETYMRSNVMVQGQLAVNYSSDNKYPAQNYFKRRAFDGLKNMVTNVPFLDDKTLGELVMYGGDNDRQLSSGQQPIIEITFLRDEFDKYMSVNNEEYDVVTGHTKIELHDVRFISRSHSTAPTADNIVETYQFIAKDII